MEDLRPIDDLDDLDDLTATPGGEHLVADLRAALVAEPDPAVARRHIEAMVAAAPGRSASVTSISGGRKALVAAGLASAMVLGSAGLAAAGELPSSAQRAAAAMALPFGIHLPTPHHESHDADADDDQPQDTSTTIAGSTTVPSSNDPATEGTGRDHAADGRDQQVPAAASDGGSTRADPPGAGDHGQADPAQSGSTGPDAEDSPSVPSTDHRATTTIDHGGSDGGNSNGRGSGGGGGR